MSPPGWQCAKCVEPMKEIDFLPIRYRERSVQRRARLWRALMVCCLAAFVVAVAVAQQALRRSLERQLAALNTRYPAAAAESARVNQLQQDAAETDAFGALYTYLDHPWPTTQLLTAVAAALPETAVISEMKLETSQIPNTVSAPSPPPSSAPPATAADAAKRDLDQLRAAQDKLAFTLHISGLTSDTKQLHDFVRQLAPSPLFKSAKLESLESRKTENQVAESRFELRLFLRAGFGQPGGPVEPLLESSTPIGRARLLPSRELGISLNERNGASHRPYNWMLLVGPAASAVPLTCPGMSRLALLSRPELRQCMVGSGEPTYEMPDSLPTYEFIATSGEARP